MTTHDDDTPESRDDRVRQHQFELLAARGVQRARDVKDSADGVVSGGRGVIPVRVIDADGDAAFVAADRVLVPAEKADRAAKLLAERIDVTQAEGGRLVVKDVRGTTYREIRATGVALPDSVNDELLSGELEGRANHLVFAAYKYKVKEGEDPEDGSVPAPNPDREGIGCHATVAILDTGMAWQARHDPWLGDVATATAPYDVDLLRTSGNAADPLDFGAGHGTFVAGIVRQIAPAATIHVVRVLDSNGVGLESEIAKGFARAVALGPDVILCAFGGYAKGDAAPPVIEQAVADVPKSTVVIAAAGNERQDRRPIWPASCRGVEAIAAADSASDGSLVVVQGEARRAWYSNWGPEVVYAAAGTWRSSFVRVDERLG
jgi:hypothetical protein